MKTFFQRPTVWLMGLALLGLNACQKDYDVSESSLAAEDAGAAGNLLDDMGDEAALRTMAENSSCPVVTFSEPDGVYPNVITLDFGDGCTDDHGRTKAGRIVIEISDDLLTEGAVRTAHTEDFSINGREVEGTRTVTNIGTNESGEYLFSIQVERARVGCSDGEAITFNADHTATMVTGADTPEREDDAFLVEGTEWGTNRRGHEFTAVITEPIYRSRDCRWPLSGVREITSGDKVRSLDYGDGQCDNIAVLTLGNGKTRSIELPR